ncbi:MAG: hypothetical protein WC476_08795 [Phycisphaerae bacterium]|jgi:hypothetical protein
MRGDDMNRLEELRTQAAIKVLYDAALEMGNKMNEALLAMGTEINALMPPERAEKVREELGPLIGRKCTSGEMIEAVSRLAEAGSKIDADYESRRSKA